MVKDERPVFDRVAVDVWEEVKRTHNPVVPGSPSGSGSRPPSPMNGAVQRGLGQDKAVPRARGAVPGWLVTVKTRSVPCHVRGQRPRPHRAPAASRLPPRAQINTQGSSVGQRLMNGGRLEILLAGSGLGAGAPHRPSCAFCPVSADQSTSHRSAETRASWKDYTPGFP